MVNLQELIKAQTSGGYPTTNYNTNQTNTWNQGSYVGYSHQYSNYNAEPNGVYAAQSDPAAPQYQPDYSKQWADYYSQTEVTCAPGTENVSSTSASNLVTPLPAVANGYSAPSSHQPVASSAPSSWRPEPGLSELSSVQPSVPINNAHEGYWKPEGQNFQHYHVSSTQSNFQNPSELNPVLGSSYNQQNPEVLQQQSVQYSASQAVAQSYQPTLPPPPPTSAPFDTVRVSQMQIPTNPRISSNLHMGLPKNNNASTGVTKPAYISVSLPKPNDNASSHAPADSSLKPGVLPPSLRGYVERALARCKDDRQMAACQDILKEVITKASNDGTLSTRDWDTEPLFTIPDSNVINNNNSSTPPSIMKSRRSPTRRTKSRWEPLPEEKSVEKQASFTPDSFKYSGSSHNNERDDQFSTGKLEKKENKFSNLAFYISNKKETNKAGLRPAKRQHVGDGRIGSNNGDSSSDSDKEQSLTAYYTGAITLADSPEERKRRESRSKRFEKNHGNRAASNLARTKNAGAGNLYSRRASISVLANSTGLDDGAASRAVEDIDWDSLTVKGTCQEIEKRYLRLTSAPDPATVRPEEVLEKALLLVQNSQKNYLYKCDQLKSIRQDLTVQRIRNELTVRVYETHARLAIEVGDLSEYNQCQSQLQTLYAEGIKGCDTEFSAYNLLCVILHSNNNRDLLSAMSRLSLEARKDAGIKHALAVRAAVTSGNYVLFFRLYKTAPNLNTCLMDLYVEKMRYAAVKCMTRSYRPTLPVFYVAQVLGFQSAEMSEKDTGGLEECTEWLKAHGACLTMDNNGEMMLDSKASMATLFMPEPDDAVAHGDASLAVNDFLTRSLS
uniref:SAC3 family protein A isoform X2 n=1 Tax=Erigeron canadensis TaxID=72917 RepID=UPI001CB8E5F5|nr:SAC3 family protein A isoform X2 [Erigeron canadensis]